MQPPGQEQEVAGPPPRVPKRSPRRSPSPTKQDDALHISMPLHRQTSATSSLASAYSQNDSPVVVSKSEQPSIFPTSETPSPPAGEKPTSNSHNRKASVVSVDEQQSILRSPKEDSFGAGFNDEALVHTNYDVDEEMPSSSSSLYSKSSRQRSRTVSNKSSNLNLGEKPYFPIPNRASSALFPDSQYEYEIPPSCPPTPPPRMSSAPSSPAYVRALPIPIRPRTPSTGPRTSSRPRTPDRTPGNRSPKSHSPRRAAFDYSTMSPPHSLPSTPLFGTPLKNASNLRISTGEFDGPEDVIGLGVDQPEEEDVYSSVLASYVASSPEDTKPTSAYPDLSDDYSVLVASAPSSSEYSEPSTSEAEVETHVRGHTRQAESTSSSYADAQPIRERESITSSHSQASNLQEFSDAKSSVDTDTEMDERDILSEIQAAIDETQRSRSHSRSQSQDLGLSKPEEEFDQSHATIVPPEDDVATPMVQQQGYFDGAISPRTSSQPQMEKRSRDNSKENVRPMKLTRIRPMCAAAEYADIKVMRTSLDRCRAYATRINALSREDTGLQAWLATKSKPKPVLKSSYSGNSQRRASQPAVAASAVSSLNRLRRSSSHFSHGYEPSTAEFPMRQDSGRATDLTNTSPAPAHFNPSNLPFPGALPVSRAQTQSFSASLRAASPGLQAAAKQNMNPLSSLGRRMSKKSGPAQGKSISSPLQAPPRTSLHGPRDIEHGERSSFSSLRAADIKEVRSEDVDQLSGILPNASRDTLERYLGKSNGDMSVAISSYLEDERQRAA